MMVRCIESDKRRLVLLIHDEAHYAVTKAGAVHTFLNDPRVRDASIFVQLLVSATPYLLQTRESQIPAENEIDWMESENEEESSTYYGLEQYHAQSQERDQAGRGGVVKCDDDFEEHCKKVKPTQAGNGGTKANDQLKKAARRDALIEQYICAMMVHEKVDGEFEGKV